MFRKIVSNLSLSPSAGSQLTYYLKRLQKEGATRRISMVFAVGLVVLQIATVVSPTHAANTPSTNDIIWGGLNTSDPKADLLNIYDQNHDSNGHTGYQNLFAHFSITRDEIQAASVSTINSGDHAIHSLGRNHRFADDQQITVDKVTYYYRTLADWGDNLTYPAIKGTRADGSFFAIMIDCGNIAVDTIPVTPPPAAPPPKATPAKLQITKTVMAGYPAAGSQVPPGTTLGYKLTYKNIGGSETNNANIADPVPAHTKVTLQGGGTPVFDELGHDSNNIPTVGAVNHLWWTQRTFNAGDGGYVQFTVKIDADTPNGTKICNVAYFHSTELPVIKSDQICYTVVKAAPPPPPPPPPPPAAGVPIVSAAKAVSNVTKNIADANGTTAAAGDELKYTLTNKNSGTAAATNYLVDEDVSDILAYADITDAGGATLTSSHLRWPVVASIAADSQIQKSFTVKIKDPIPSTPTTLNDPGLFDLKLDNVYGNAVEVKLPAPPPKQVEVATEQVATALPQTGSGTTTVIVFAIIAGMVYLYFRNRQLVRELKLLRVDNVVGQ